MKRAIVRLIVIAAVAFLPIPLHAQKPGETVEKVSKSFKVGSSGTLDISNVSGKVIVSEGGADTIVIDAVKKFRGTGSAKEQFAATTLEMVERAGRVEVKTIYTARNTKVSVDYTVTAPAGTSVFAHSMSGDVKVANIKGEVRIDTVSGDVAASGTPNATLVKTTSGDASAIGIDHQTELRISSISGDVTLTSVRARSIDADVTSGSVTLTNVNAERVTAKAFSGDLAYAGYLAKGGRYQFQSQSGDVQLTLAAASEFELDAGTFSGSITCDFPVTLPPGQAVGGKSSRKSLRGVVGAGGATLSIRAFSGDVAIVKK